ncbi:hypothetical protein P153DRAFT_354738 [Dothidotthia symphoricarpi CBS 119687]|uniref:Uncharacterized protein n=1 Tax=Dothidotthia symphoricarpi CBS 119687 TaxID=1392245 RepID=A0A6A6ALT8_9PLEO|nr:uncharacterized protein P153DRAFT_354738 [Dothidotthia symphoricarpi CBS 119687]KAF2132088.1 hypothetical protein P153DRAFT_354738 [Dothidotthia symphoricarpi CBS 119687]
MSASSQTVPNFATAWLAPPEGLLPPSQKIKLEPVSLTISGVLALALVVVTLLLWNRKHMPVFMGDRIKEPEEADVQQHIVRVRSDKEIRTPTSISSKLSGHPSVYRSPRVDAHAIQSSMNHDVQRLALAHHKIPKDEDEASDFFNYESTHASAIWSNDLSINNLYQSRRTQIPSNVDTDSQYEDSFAPSTFVMMSRSQTGDNY